MLPSGILPFHYILFVPYIILPYLTLLYLTQVFRKPFVSTYYNIPWLFSNVPCSGTGRVQLKLIRPRMNFLYSLYISHLYILHTVSLLDLTPHYIFYYLYCPFFLVPNSFCFPLFSHSFNFTLLLNYLFANVPKLVIPIFSVYPGS